MHLLCRFYSLSEFPTGAKVRACIPKSEDFREFSRFVESVRGPSRKVLERIGMLENAPRMCRKVHRYVFRRDAVCEKIKKIAISHRDGSANARVREQKKGL